MVLRCPVQKPTLQLALHKAVPTAAAKPGREDKIHAFTLDVGEPPPVVLKRAFLKAYRAFIVLV